MSSTATGLASSPTASEAGQAPPSRLQAMPAGAAEVQQQAASLLLDLWIHLMPDRQGAHACCTWILREMSSAFTEWVSEPQEM